MKMMIGVAALAVASLGVTMPAAAETYFSGGLGVETMDINVSGLSEASIPVATARFGWRSASWYGVEGDLTFGLSSDEVDPSIEVSINSAAYIYGVAFFPVGEKVELIARVGYGHQATDVEAFGSKETANDGAVSYGVGATYNLNGRNSLRVDYTIFDIEDVDAAAATLSFVRSF